MATVCDSCYEGTCARSANPALQCVYIAGAKSTFKVGAFYQGAFLNTLPTAAQNVDAHHWDHLTGLGTPGTAAAGAMSPAHAALLVHLTADTLPIADLGECIYFLVLWPMYHQEVTRNAARLATAATAGQQPLITNSLSAAKDARQEAKTVGQTVGPTTATAYKQSQAPRSQLLQKIIKNVEAGEMTEEDPSIVFDPSSGKVVVPFDKMKKVTTPSRLQYAIGVFCQTMSIVKGESPTVYYRFQREIMRITDTYGMGVGHKVADKMLRLIDDGTYKNMVDLFNQGLPNRVLTDVLRDADNKPTPPKKQTGGGEVVDSRTRIQFGSVKQPLGGPGAGLITHFRTGAKLKCKMFHATPRQPCTAGVPANHAGTTPDKWGQCAYEH